MKNLLKTLILNGREISETELKRIIGGAGIQHPSASTGPGGCNGGGGTCTCYCDPP